MLASTPVGFESAVSQKAEGGGPPRDVVLRRLRAEFAEMPGLVLTAAQAARLCGAGRQDSEWALHQLAEQGVLRRTRDRGFVRA